MIDGALTSLGEQPLQFFPERLLLLRCQFRCRRVLPGEELTSLCDWCDAGLVRLAVDQQHVRAVFFRGTQIERRKQRCDRAVPLVTQECPALGGPGMDPVGCDELIAQRTPEKPDKPRVAAVAERLGQFRRERNVYTLARGEASGSWSWGVLLLNGRVVAHFIRAGKHLYHHERLWFTCLRGHCKMMGKTPDEPCRQTATRKILCPRG